jgi:hypothetical protein
MSDPKPLGEDFNFQKFMEETYKDYEQTQNELK